MASTGRSEIIDLLPWPITTRKRGSNRVAVGVGEPSNPTGMELALVDAGNRQKLEIVLPRVPLHVLEYTFRRRMQVIRQQAQAFNEFICHICGRTFSSRGSLSGHKGHHTRQEKKRQLASMEVEYEPPVKRPRQCPMCERTFNTGQGLGVHRRHCKASPAPVESHGGVILPFDLNAFPPPEPEQMLALPWYGNRS